MTWFQVRQVEGEGAQLRAPVVARSRSLARASEQLITLRRQGIADERLGLFQATRREGSDGRWWRMPRVLA